MGVVLLIVLLLAWYREKGGIKKEKLIRRKMIWLHLKKHAKGVPYTKKDQEQFEKLSKQSVADTKELQSDVKDYVHDIINSPIDEKEFAKKELKIDKK